MSRKITEAGKRARRRWRVSNREAGNAAGRAWYAANRNRVAEQRRNAALLNPERIAYHQKKSKLKPYGMTPEEFDKLKLDQNGVCKLCGKLNRDGKELNVDHDHTSNTVRGLLCGPCNKGLGLLGDSVEGLERALRYLNFARESESGCFPSRCPAGEIE